VVELNKVEPGVVEPDTIDASNGSCLDRSALRALTEEDEPGGGSLAIPNNVQSFSESRLAMAYSVKLSALVRALKGPPSLVANLMHFAAP
jgi:hypothetical protein